MSWLSTRVLKAEIIAPIIVGIVAGLGSSWITVNADLARLKQKSKQDSHDIEHLESKQAEQGRSLLDLSQRLARVETKIDLLLEDAGVEYRPEHNSE